MAFPYMTGLNVTIHFLLSLAMILMGIVYFDKCPACPMIVYSQIRKYNISSSYMSYFTIENKATYPSVLGLLILTTTSIETTESVITSAKLKFVLSLVNSGSWAIIYIGGILFLGMIKWFE